jgi:hypothetical protein
LVKKVPDELFAKIYPSKSEAVFKGFSDKNHLLAVSA